MMIILEPSCVNTTYEVILINDLCAYYDDMNRRAAKLLLESDKLKIRVNQEFFTLKVTQEDK